MTTYYCCHQVQVQYILLLSFLILLKMLSSTAKLKMLNGVVLGVLLILILVSTYTQLTCALSVQLTCLLAK